MIYTFIADRCADLPVDTCCRAMKVSRSAFYAWRHAEADPTVKMLADCELGDLVAKIHDASFGTYGVLRVTAELRLGLGRQVNHKRVERLMRERGLQGAPAGDAPRVAPAAVPTIHARTISCTASSDPTALTGCGCKTSPSTAPARVGSTSPS